MNKLLLLIASIFLTFIISCKGSTTPDNGTDNGPAKWGSAKWGQGSWGK